MSPPHLLSIIRIMFKLISKSFLLDFATVSKINPHDKDKAESIIIHIETNNVGNRGTSPVNKNSAKTGANITAPIINNISDIIPKNCNGL